MIKHTGKEVRRRYRQVRRLWHEGGGKEVLNRVRRAAAGRLEPTALHLPVRQADILAKYSAAFPKVPTFTIDEVFGGWTKAQQTHFADGGVFDKIYEPGS